MAVILNASAEQKPQELNPKARLLDQMREGLRLEHYALRTEEKHAEIK